MNLRQTRVVGVSLGAALRYVYALQPGGCWDSRWTTQRWRRGLDPVHPQLAVTRRPACHTDPQSLRQTYRPPSHQASSHMYRLPSTL